jgi:hypothetical protein
MPAVGTKPTSRNVRRPVAFGCNPGGTPSPNPTARIHKSLQAEQRPVEARQLELPRVSFCGGQDAFPTYPSFAGECVAPATLLEIIELLSGKAGTTDIITS